jgi:hypothetical protein
MDSNHRSPARKSRFLVAESELRDRTGAAKRLSLMRHRWFESISLQRGVCWELDTVDQGGSSAPLPTGGYLEQADGTA